MNSLRRATPLRFAIASAATLGALVATSPPAAAAPPAAAELVAPSPGTLFVCGGGALPDRVYDEFVTAAGGEKARIVVVPTASESADAVVADAARTERLLSPWRERKVAGVVLFHARTAAEADDVVRLRSLREATGVWFGGGSQRRLAEAYVGTRFLREVQGVLARGGAVGGTSAGAAVMTDPMIAGDPIAEVSQRAKGFGLLAGAVVDQHFTARQREPRLAAAVALDPRLVGFGIDEATALVVRGRELSVVGAAQVHVVVAPAGRDPLALRLTEGDRDDLVALSRAARDRLPAAATPPNATPPRATSPIVPHGTLVIVGGGGMPREALDRFIAAAGGKDAKIVVVPTVADPTAFAGEMRLFTKAGCTNVVVVASRTPAEADAAENLSHLAEARGVWFGGGRQWRFVDAFEGTKCLAAFHDVLRRGGVIGGSSAGATIQGEYLCRGSPVVNTIMSAHGYERGFAFLPGSAVDQHFTQRKRGPDLEALVRRRPDLLGIGVDETTALVVSGARAEVVGAHTVSFYPPSKDRDAAAAEPPPPIVLRAGESYDLRSSSVGR